MKNTILIQLMGIVACGALAQLAAAFLKVPSILLLLLIGLLVGPGLGWIQPDLLFGDLLFPLVALSVAIILFEGGLGLRVAEIRQVWGAVRALVVGGPLVSWFLISLAAFVILHFSIGLSLLLGALLVVTGPTVTIPLLRHVKPKRELAAALGWEAILTDPIGALLAVVVYEVMASGSEFSGLPSLAFGSVAGMILLGIAAGVGFAGLVIALIRTHAVPERLEAPLTFSLVIVAFVLSNQLLHESGLLAVTVMGMALGNQKRVPVRHISEFKENLQVLLLSTLFIVLAARIDLSQVAALGLPGVLFALTLFPLRIAAVALVTAGSGLSYREKLFIGFLAPRGIVAAAVSSLLGFQLSGHGIPGAELLAPAVFTVILTTVILCALFSKMLARALGLAGSGTEITVILGAHRFARLLARCLNADGFDTLLIDTNEYNVRRAAADGLQTFHGSITSDECREMLAMQNVGRFLALTSNDKTNLLGALAVLEVAKEGELYKVRSNVDERAFDVPVAAFARVRPLFGPELSAEQIETQMARGAAIVPMSHEDLTADGPSFVYAVLGAGQLVFEPPGKGDTVSAVRCLALP